MFRLNKPLYFILIGFLFFLSFAVNAEPIDQLFHHASDPVAGNPNGTITVVEFFDYQCPHCMNMAPVLTNILKDNANVRVVYKDYPILGPLSEFIARAALAAKMQGKYVAFNHALLTTNSYLTEDGVFQIAQNVGLNVAKLKKDMNSATITAQLNNTLALAGELKIESTPAFFIGRTNAKSKNNVNYVLGEMSQSELQDAINTAKTK